MPTISAFYGILIQMFWNDHPPPTFTSAMRIHGRESAFKTCKSYPAACRKRRNVWYSNGRSSIKQSLWKTGYYVNGGRNPQGSTHFHDFCRHSPDHLQST
jgi:hypothetical protein